MVEIAEGTEHAQSRALLVGNDQSLLSRALNLEHLDDGAGSGDSTLKDVLVDVFCVLCCLLQESLVRDLLEAGVIGAWVGVLEGSLVDEVASELLVDISRQAARRAEGFDSVAVGPLGVVQVFLVDSLLITWAGGRGDARLAGVDEDGMVGCFLVKTDL